MSLISRLFAVRMIDSIVGETERGPRLERVLTARSLTAIGLGSTVGSGIFVLTGTVAANHAGPALTLALLIAAIGSVLAAICYAELAAMMPVSGSAYSYTYATLGEVVAWIVGWNLSLEYLVAASAVAVGWSGYVVNILSEWGLHLPAALTDAPFGRSATGTLGLTGSIINLPAVLIIVLLGWVCYVGIRVSSTANAIMVAIKITVIALFIVAGLAFVDTANWTPYIPQNTGTFGQFGWTGVLQGAGIITFAYIGFDTAATTAGEARNPQRDLPIAILCTLVICAALYIGMAAVMTGMVRYTQLGAVAPVAVALDAHPQLAWLGSLIKLGAIAGMTSVMLMSLLGQSRVLLAMANDGLLPGVIREIHSVHRTPHVATGWSVFLAALLAGLLPLNVMGELISIGILLTFTVVCIGVLVLRRRQPDAPRPFRVPWASVTCVAGALVCSGITYFLPADTWWRLLIWTGLGLSIYALYGFRHSRLRADGR